MTRERLVMRENRVILELLENRELRDSQATKENRAQLAKKEMLVLLGPLVKLELPANKESQDKTLQVRLELREPPENQGLRENPALMEKSVLKERRDQMVRLELLVRPANKELRAKLDLREKPAPLVRLARPELPERPVTLALRERQETITLRRVPSERRERRENQVKTPGTSSLNCHLMISTRSGTNLLPSLTSTPRSSYPTILVPMEKLEFLASRAEKEISERTVLMEMPETTEFPEFLVCLEITAPRVNLAQSVKPERLVRPETRVLMATLVNPVMSEMSEITVKMEMKVLRET